MSSSSEYFKIDPRDYSLKKVAKISLKNHEEDSLFILKFPEVVNVSSSGYSYTYYDLIFIDKHENKLYPIIGNFQLLSPISERYNSKVTGITADTWIEIKELKSGDSFSVHYPDIGAMAFWKLLAEHCTELKTLKELELAREINKLKLNIRNINSQLDFQKKKEEALIESLIKISDSFLSIYSQSLNELPKITSSLRIPFMPLGGSGNELWKKISELQSITENFPSKKSGENLE